MARHVRLRQVRHVRGWATLRAAMVWSLVAGALSGAGAPAELLPFLKAHCYECHDSEVAKGGLDLTTLAYGSDPATHVRWVRLHDRVADGDMPPAKKPRPEPAARAAFLAALGKDLTAQHLANRGTVLRRLNRAEYANTLVSLFGMRIPAYDDLPEDGLALGFDTIGEALSLSEVHLRRYLAAAEGTLASIELQAAEPPRTSQRLGYADAQGAKLGFSDNYWLRQGDGSVVIFNDGTTPSSVLSQMRIEHGGLHRIRIQGAAYQSGTPLTIAVHVGEFGRHADTTLVGHYDLTPGAGNTIELTTWLRRGDRLKLVPLGLSLPGAARRTLARYPGPGMAIRAVEVEGPLFEQWPSLAQRRLFGTLPVEVPAPPVGRARGPLAPPEVVPADPERDGARLLRAFATAAFRRPVSEAQVQPYVALLRSELANRAGFTQAMLTAAGAVLCAPDFLFLLERTRGGAALDDHAVANRLAYFLTRTMPDDELLGLAAAGKLRTPAILKAQTERLLAHPHHQRFLADFTDGWLDLRNIDATTPDEQLYPEFDERLQRAMVGETRAFLGELIARNLPPVNLVRSDFAMLNERLARHYGIAGVAGEAIRAVKLPPDSPRGGILTQAAVLKVSANGTTTSPVVRGVYVLERLLGVTPPPPPPGTAGVEPDIRGATTIREQLAKHRHLEACNGCHRVIDPPGFALERFDVIGGWRERFRSLDQGDPVRLEVGGRKAAYKLGPPVDAGGELLGVGTFRDFTGFRDLLLRQRGRVTAAFAGRLLAFATGREMGFSDRAVIARLVDQLGDQGGVRDLLHLAVQSEIFLSK